MTAFEIQYLDGQTNKMILRQPSLQVFERNPHAAEDEFKVLQLTKSLGLATQTPYYLDQSGTIFSTPYLVMEFIEGKPEFPSATAADFTLELAKHLAMIHSADHSQQDTSFLPGSANECAEISRDRLSIVDPTVDDGRIRSVLEEISPISQQNAPVLLHGDYWPGNILWRDDTLVAVIDWEDAQIGDPLIDFAISRLDMLWIFGSDAMQAFTQHYQSYLNQFTQPDTIVPNPYNPQDWNRYSYARNNPLRYTDPSGHVPWLIGAALIAVDYLTFTGVLPDMKGTVLTVALTDTNDATVAAGIAVQSEWLGPQDIPAVMSVYDRVTGGDPDSHNYGLAQTNSSEMEDLQICVECNPWDLSLADDTIGARIQSGLGACDLCNSGADTLIVSALAQNGFDVTLFDKLQANPDGALDWREFLNKYGGNPSDSVAKMRQELTGDNYETELMLRLYMNDLRLLLKLGYKLPKGITEADIKKVEEVIGNYK